MNDPRTGYKGVKAEILHRIRNGEWLPGALLPGEVDLAYEFGCARATVNRAMRELAEDGVIDRRRKAGTRVRMVRARQAKFSIPLVRVEIEAAGATYRYALVKKEILAAPDWLRARLGLSMDAQLMRLQCMHYADNAPFQFEDRWINIDAVPEILGADLSKSGPNDWLVDAVPFTDAEISFSAAAADADLARFLEITAGEPVFQAERTTWLDSKPVTHAKLSFAPGYRMTTRF